MESNMCGTEIWKPVVGYEGRYEVSSLGRVRSLDRERLKGRVLKDNNGEGYLQVGLCKNGKRCTKRVHSLVAEAFLGPPNGMDVCRGPGGKFDNSVGNLSYGSRRKNCGVDRNRDHQYTSKFPGVSWHMYKNKWQANAYLNGKCNHLGLFESEEEAYKAYKKAVDDAS